VFRFVAGQIGHFRFPFDCRYPIPYRYKDTGCRILEIVPMSLAEVLPEVLSLSRLDKIRLIQFLAQDLEEDESGLIEPGRSYPIWSPDKAFTAAAALLQALEAENGQP